MPYAHGRMRVTPICTLAIAAAMMLGVISTEVGAATQLTPSNCLANQAMPAMYSCWQDQQSWMGLAVNPSDDTENTYLEIFGNASGTGDPFHGSYLPDQTNFMVRNYAGEPDTWAFAKVRGDAPMTNQYVVEWDIGQGLLPFGTPISHNYGGLYWDCGLLHVWDLPLTAGEEYLFYLNRTGQGSVRMALLYGWGPGGWLGRGDALWEAEAEEPGVNNPYSFTCWSTETYALVVFHNSASWQTGDFTIAVQPAAPTPEPDLVIDHIEPNTATPGTNITATIYVKNQGGGDAAFSYTSVSVDGSVTCAQVYTPNIPAGAQVQVQCDLGSHATGTLEVEACADVTNQIIEEYETNNCRMEYISVQPAGNLPDLQVTAMGPTHARTGEFYSMWAFVENRGTAPATASYTEFQFDGGIICAQVATPALAAGALQTVWCDFGNIGDGTHDIQACADITDLVAESNENNNCEYEQVLASAPDLIVENIEPDAVPYGEGVTATITVRNIGSKDAGASRTSLAVDGVIFYHAIPTPTLPPGDFAEVQGYLGTFDFGDYTLEGCADVDDQVDESNENNNCRDEILTVQVPETVIVHPDGTGDFPTIQAAIDNVPVAGTVRLTAGIFSGPGNRDLDCHGKEITIESVDLEHPEQFIIDCEGSSGSHHRGFIFENGEGNDCILRGVMIRNGYATHGAGILCDNSGPTIRSVILVDNEATGYGGAISCTADYVHPPFMRLQYVTIVGNDAYDGGAVSFSNDMTLGNVLVTDNGGRHGAVLGLGGAEAILSCCNLFGNSGDWVYGIADQYGHDGNISLDPLYCNAAGGDYGLHSDSPCRPENNPACGLIGGTTTVCGPSGGHTYRVNAEGTGDYPTIQAAIDACVDDDIIELDPGAYEGVGNRDINFNGKAITIRNSGGIPGDYVIFLDASAADPHIGFRFNSGEGPTSVLQGVSIKGGYGWDGGGIACTHGSSPTILDCWFNYCEAQDDGGGLYCSDASSPIVTGCEFEYCMAGDLGGGAETQSGSAPEFHDCRFRGNAAGTHGGGATIRQGDALFDGCLFDRNTAIGSAGGLYLYTSGTTEVRGCTFYRNQAPIASGIRPDDGTTAIVEQTILSNGLQGAAIACAGSGSAQLSCCDVYSNAGGDYVGCIAGQGGQNGNFSSNPLYCDIGGYDFTLHSDSPCAPGYNPACGRVGAFEVGCPCSTPITCLVQPDGSGDYPTIQAAVDDVIDGSVIELAGGVFQGEGNRDVNFSGKAITIRSQSGNPEDCVINCGGSEAEPHRGFLFLSGEGPDACLLGLTLTGGYVSSGGAVRVSASAPTIQDCIFIANTAQNGGGVTIGSGSNPTITGCRFIGNHGTNAGGASNLNSSAATFTRCEFIGNDATWGGGALYFYASQGAVVECTFRENYCDHWGGAVHSDIESSTPLLQHCTFYANEAPEGSALYTRVFAHATLENCILSFGADGEAVRCHDDGEATLTCCDVFGNAGGDWVGCIAAQAGIAGNLSADPDYCDAENADFTIGTGSPCAPDNHPTCGLIGAWPVACTSQGSGVEEDPRFLAWSGDAVVLLGAAPNPFGGTTAIRFGLPRPMHLSLRIFDIEGRLVRNLFEGHATAGAQSITWDGRDETGHRTMVGVYFMRLAAEGPPLTRALFRCP